VTAHDDLDGSSGTDFGGSARRAPDILYRFLAALLPQASVHVSVTR
jgi:hypothetical protein